MAGSGIHGQGRSNDATTVRRRRRRKARASTGRRFSTPSPRPASHPCCSMPSTSSRSRGARPDIADSVWLARVCQFGLCNPSLVPPKAFRELRRVARARRKIVAERTPDAQPRSQDRRQRRPPCRRRPLRPLRGQRTAHPRRAGCGQGTRRDHGLALRPCPQASRDTQRCPRKQAFRGRPVPVGVTRSASSTRPVSGSPNTTPSSTGASPNTRWPSGC